MELSKARSIGESLLKLIGPAVKRAEIAGSVRRVKFDIVDDNSWRLHNETYEKWMNNPSRYTVVQPLLLLRYSKIHGKAS